MTALMIDIIIIILLLYPYSEYHLLLPPVVDINEEMIYSHMLIYIFIHISS